MKRRLLLFPLLLAGLSPARAVDEPTPAIRAFAKKLEGVRPPHTLSPLHV